MTIFFYLILSGIFVWMYGPTWLGILWTVVVAFDVYMVPAAWKTSKKIRAGNEKNAQKARLYDQYIDRVRPWQSWERLENEETADQKG